MTDRGVLVTRPEPGASATAARLAGLGFTPILAPCLTIEGRSPPLPARVGAIALTSAQALPHLPARFAETPLYAVGDATAGRARAAGFHRVISAAGTAADLARLICRDRPPGPILLATGAGHGAALAAGLREGRLRVIRRAVYAARPARALPAPARGALMAGTAEAALFFSAETAAAFLRLRPPNTERVIACALSDTVADALRAAAWTGIRVASAPTEADLLALLA